MGFFGTGKGFSGSVASTASKISGIVSSAVSKLSGRSSGSVATGGGSSGAQSYGTPVGGFFKGRIKFGHKKGFGGSGSSPVKFQKREGGTDRD